MSTAEDKERRSEAVLAVIATLRPRTPYFRATELYGRMRPERPRFRAAWECFEAMEPRSILHTLDRLEAEGRISRARRRDGYLRADRVYELPAKQEAA